MNTQGPKIKAEHVGAWSSKSLKFQDLPERHGNTLRNAILDGFILSPDPKESVF